MIRKFFSKDRIIALCNAFMKMKENDNFSVNIVVYNFKKITGKDEGIRNVRVYIGSSNSVVHTLPAPGEIPVEKLNNWFVIDCRRPRY